MGGIGQGTRCPKDASSKGHVVQWSHCPRDGTSKTFRSGKPRSGTLHHAMVWSVELNSVVFFANSSSMARSQPTLTYCGQSLLAGRPDIPDTLLDRDVNIRIHTVFTTRTIHKCQTYQQQTPIITTHADPIQKNETNALDSCPKIMSIWLCVCSSSWESWRKGGGVGCWCE